MTLIGLGWLGGNLWVTIVIIIFTLWKESYFEGDKYDYSQVSYLGNKKFVTILCPIHGVFQQIPNSHLLGKGCQKCALQDQYSFIEKANLKHANEYDYSKVVFISNIDKVNIICSKHGEFLQSPHNHLRGAKCPKCNSSKGEHRIIECLQELNIEFEYQKKFDDLKNVRRLSLDFYIPSLRLAIEYNGKQHFQPEGFGSKQEDPIEKFAQYKQSDNIKKKYCESHDIRLCVIPFWDFKSIKEILIQWLVEENLYV